MCIPFGASAYKHLLRTQYYAWAQNIISPPDQDHVYQTCIIYLQYIRRYDPALSCLCIKFNIVKGQVQGRQKVQMGRTCNTLNNVSTLQLPIALYM